MKPGLAIAALAILSACDPGPSDLERTLSAIPPGAAVAWPDEPTGTVVCVLGPYGDHPLLPDAARDAIGLGHDSDPTRVVRARPGAAVELAETALRVDGQSACVLAGGATVLVEGGRIRLEAAR